MTEDFKCTLFNIWIMFIFHYQHGCLNAPTVIDSLSLILRIPNAIRKSLIPVSRYIFAKQRHTQKYSPCKEFENKPVLANLFFFFYLFY